MGVMSPASLPARVCSFIRQRVVVLSLHRPEPCPGPSSAARVPRFRVGARPLVATHGGARTYGLRAERVQGGSQSWVCETQSLFSCYYLLIIILLTLSYFNCFISSLTTYPSGDGGWWFNLLPFHVIASSDWAGCGGCGFGGTEWGLPPLTGFSAVRIRRAGHTHPALSPLSLCGRQVGCWALQTSQCRMELEAAQSVSDFPPMPFVGVGPGRGEGNAVPHTWLPPRPAGKTGMCDRRGHFPL